MSLPIERASGKRRITWLTVIGIILLPAVIGGVLVAALWNPTDRLDNITAAIVNDDEPVTIDDQLVPLGRQLAAGLVEGSDEVGSNIDWVISNSDDAADGIADGTYDAVITIPASFSEAATSTTGDDPVQARIEVTTAKDARVFDAAITNQIAAVATTTMGTTLSETYLENVLLGFTTLGEKLGTAADGASELATGASSAAEGATGVRDGATALADGLGQLDSGAGQLATGAGTLASGTSELATGAADLASGAGTAADGTWQLAGGLDQLAGGMNQAVAGIGTLAQQIRAGADQAASTQLLPAEFLTAVDASAAQTAALGEPVGAAATQAGAAAASAGTAATDAGTLAATLAALQATCAEQGSDAALCAGIASAAASAQSIAANAGTAAQSAAASAQTGAATIDAIVQAATSAGTVAGYVNGADGQAGLKDALPQGFAAQLRQIADGVDQVSAGMAPLQSGLATAASSSQQLAFGTSQLAGGAQSLADGTTSLSSGAGTLASGATQLADGVNQSASGAGQLADGTSQLSDGVGQLADGTDSLATGLGDAVAQIPSYTDAQAKTLASVVADPVTSDAGTDALFGGSAIPLLTVVALWFGALASFIVMRARTRKTLASSAPSALLALGSLIPAAAIGVVQGVLVAGVVQIAQQYDAGTWFALAGLSASIGVAFAAVNQALVAVLGGAGRWVSALVGALFFATGVVSTSPAFLDAIAGVLPTAPGYRALLTVVTDTPGLGAALVALAVWAVVAFLATTLSIVRRRSTSARALLASA